MPDSEGSMAVPHSTQNLPPSDAVPQEGHWRPWTGDPHSGQNFAPAGTTASHTEHPFTVPHPRDRPSCPTRGSGRRYYPRLRREAALGTL